MLIIIYTHTHHIIQRWLMLCRIESKSLVWDNVYTKQNICCKATAKIIQIKTNPSPEIWKWWPLCNLFSFIHSTSLQRSIQFSIKKEWVKCALTWTWTDVLGTVLSNCIGSYRFQIVFCFGCCNVSFTF